MSTSNPYNSPIQEVNIDVSYHLKKDYFCIRMTHNIEQCSLTCYLSADDMYRLGTELLVAANRYKDDPEKYRETIRKLNEMTS